MAHRFFLRTVDTAVAVALGIGILYALMSVAPVALSRWF